MTANKCDRCGTLYEREYTPDVRINIYSHPYGDERVDLCPKAVAWDEWCPEFEMKKCIIATED